MEQIWGSYNVIIVLTLHQVKAQISNSILSHYFCLWYNNIIQVTSLIGPQTPPLRREKGLGTFGH